MFYRKDVDITSPLTFVAAGCSICTRMLWAFATAPNKAYAPEVTSRESTKPCDVRVHHGPLEAIKPLGPVTGDLLNQNLMTFMLGESMFLNLLVYFIFFSKQILIEMIGNGLTFQQ